MIVFIAALFAFYNWSGGCPPLDVCEVRDFTQQTPAKMKQGDSATLGRNGADI